MDYLNVLSIFGSGIQGKSGREIFSQPFSDIIPDKFTVSWCEENASAIDSWLCNTDKNIVDEATSTYLSVKPLMTTKSVRKLRMMANDTYSTFPDCTFRAVVTLAKKYNDSLGQKDISLRLRCAAKLAFVALGTINKLIAPNPVIDLVSIFFVNDLKDMICLK